MLIRRTFPVGPLQCNCSIIGDSETKKALVVDPGGDADLIYAQLQELGLKLTVIIHTHAHLDHILASGELKRLTGAPIVLHKDDKVLWDSLEMQCNMFGIPYVAQPDPDEWVHDDQDLKCCDGVAIHTPGHTPGSTSFWFESHDLLIAGDTLFMGSIGRTDIMGGDYKAIEKSIRERIYTLSDSATVITGHGPDTTIGAEKTGNAFIRA